VLVLASSGSGSFMGAFSEMEEGSLPSPAPPRRVAFSDKHSFRRIPHTAAAPTVSGTSNLFTHHEGIVDSSKIDEESHLWTPAPELENYYSNKKKSKTVPCHPMMQQTSSSFSHKRKFEESSGKKKEPERTRATWSSAWGSLQNTLKESIQNSWQLGFLWPDDDDDDDGLEYLLQEENSCEHDLDHHHHYHDLETAAKHQQQEQKHEDWVDTDSLLQPNSGKVGFSPPGYGTWHSNPYQTFSNGELKDGSLQNHSYNNKGHKASGLSNAIHPETKITHAKSTPEFIMGRDTSVMLQEDEEDITTPANSVSYGDTGIHKTTASESRNISLKPSKSMPADLHPHPAVVKKKSFHRCNTAPAMSAEAAEAVVNQNSSSSATAVKPLRKLEKSGSIVMQAGIGLMIYLAVGVMIYTWKRQEFSGLQTVSYVDALYFCIVTMCTIGYGDITPITTSSKLFACLFVLIGFGFIDILLSSMVSYVLDKQEHLLLSAVEGSHYQTARKYFMNPHHHNRVRIRLKVALAAGVPVLCITVGTIVMMQMEQLSWIDALYCTTMSITTVGYGDHTFKSFKGRLFAAVWLLFSTLAVARCFLYLAEARVDKRHRAIAKWVLRRQFSVGDLIKADLDHDGSIRYDNNSFLSSFAYFICTREHKLVLMITRSLME
jgi:potassium channel subfamily K